MSVHGFKHHPARRRIPVGARTVVVIAAIAGLYVTATGVSQDMHRSAHAATTVVGETPQRLDAQRAFDYFPDHYQLQANEPAEQIASF